MSTFSTFAGAVRAATCQIPCGQVRTYGQVAAIAGFPRAARAVGQILAKNYDPAVPCHRVVRADGHVGHYNRGTAAKVAKLMAEGVQIVAGKVMPK